MIDGFAADPEALRRAAAVAAFRPAGHHYPGIRAPVPPSWLASQMPILDRMLGDMLGFAGRLEAIDAGFAIITRRPSALTLRQRIPHCDAFDPNRFAVVHHLSDDAGGTAFYRHRATGFETINDTRAPTFFAALDGELADPLAHPRAYVAGDTPLFDQTARCAGQFNRALLYRSFALHSGVIVPDATLLPDPLAGRLTITAFFVRTQ